MNDLTNQSRRRTLVTAHTHKGNEGECVRVRASIKAVAYAPKMLSALEIFF